jgi:transcriptional regulator with XRE-family HTH domain
VGTVRDEIDDLLGIDTDDPTQRLALDLVAADRELLRRLVDLRKMRRVTQEEVGRRMGVTQPAVAAFERPDADPKLSTLRRYALALDVLVTHVVTERRTPSVQVQPSSAATGSVSHATITVHRSSHLLSVSQ